ncbi:hypothetical protein AVO42_08780 [Thiomicrospira sp. XS5]|uniref:hypothetical protein n=1 Tax=Thiomicrospira sp. XS5 TaxID=1775636 RepID=UPI00074B2F20|nr:hypothetical protein [Thiomicrospira sp. XS5]KUJ75408.1 hypothetical protein AVO42_08780 [Thiomicrospira sp. XS5]
MLGVANYVMKGPMQAFIATLLLSALTVWIAPLGILVGAIISLVTLRIGEIEGLKVLAAAVAVTLGLTLFMSGSIWPGVVGVIEYMLPIWLLSWVLRNTSSMALSLSLNMLIVGAGVIAFHLAVGDTAVWWQQVFKEFVQPVFEQTGTPFPQAMFEDLTKVATMLLAMFVVVLWFSIVLLGRWWQSALYVPGQFRTDFYEIRLPKGIAGLAVFVALVGLFTQNGLIQDLSGVLMAGLMFQGLAVAHHTVNKRQMSSMWLGGLYVLLFLFPQAVLILATIGLIDIWVDIRNRWTETE